MRMPGFTAESSLYKTSECYQHATEWIDLTIGQEVTPQAKFCCIMRYPENSLRQGVVSGCRGHDTWRPFAELGCAIEAALRGKDATLVRGICSSRPECQGKVLGADKGGGPGGPGFGDGPGEPPIHQL